MMKSLRESNKMHPASRERNLPLDSAGRFAGAGVCDHAMERGSGKERRGGLGRNPGAVRLLAGVFLGVLVALSACQSGPVEKGVAARVNGKPISIKTLEYVQALRLSSPSMVPEETLAGLKAEYGEALATLVVEELVSQELARRGLEISEAQVRNVETTLRSGYQGNAFENMLAEEGLDLAIWRERLRARLALDVFSARVLRPLVAIGPEEIQQYYRAHIQEFSQPVTLKFLKVESVNADALKAALEEAQKSKDPADLLMVFDDVSLQAQASPEDVLPRAWREALKNLKPGQTGAVTRGGLGFQAFILLERSEARVEGLVQVYPIVEKRLLEVRLAQEFASWLAQAVKKATLEISPAISSQ